MGKIHEFDNEIYPRKLWVVVDDEELVKERFTYQDDNRSEINGNDFSEAFASTLSVAERKEDGRFGILVHFSGDLLDEGGSAIVSVISHESIHAANKVFGCCDIDYDTDNDEHFAYFAGWVAKKCWLVLQEYIDYDKKRMKR